MAGELFHDNQQRLTMRIGRRGGFERQGVTAFEFTLRLGGQSDPAYQAHKGTCNSPAPIRVRIRRYTGHKLAASVVLYASLDPGPGLTTCLDQKKTALVPVPAPVASHLHRHPKVALHGENIGRRGLDDQAIFIRPRGRRRGGPKPVGIQARFELEMMARKDGGLRRV